jgi:hypothetical protein
MFTSIQNYSQTIYDLKSLSAGISRIPPFPLKQHYLLRTAVERMEPGLPEPGVERGE